MIFGFGRTLYFTGLDITLQFFDKTSTRLPEALMFAFNPVPSPDCHWYMSKIGQLVDPYNVIQNGSQYQHGEYSFLSFKSSRKQIVVVINNDCNIHKHILIMPNG